MYSFASVIDYNVFDRLYEDFMRDSNLFVLECLKYVHKSVNENLSSFEECKKIVYEHDVIEVLDVWEDQAHCSRGEFANKPTYLDFVFVPIFKEVFDVLESKYQIEFKKYSNSSHVSLDDGEIPWLCIYFRNCFEDFD